MSVHLRRAQWPFRLTGCLALLSGVFLGACTKSEHHDKASETPAAAQPGTPTAVSATPPATAVTPATATASANQLTLDAILTHYDAIRALLAADSGEGIAQHARELQAAAQQASSAAPATIQPHLAELTRQAQAMAEAPAGDLAGLRKAFGELSRPLVATMAELPELAKSHHLFECPMAEGYARWVQKEAAMANPYMGKSMLECGSELKEWK